MDGATEIVKLLVVGIRRLKPGAGELEIEVQRVFWRKYVVEAVEEIFLIAFVVDHPELRRIEEAARVEPVRRDEFPPVLAAVGEVEIQVRAAKATVTSRDGAVRGRRTLARTRGYVDHQAGLVSELSRRGTADDRHRLHGIERDLVGEHFALLVRDRLAIQRK